MKAQHTPEPWTLTRFRKENTMLTTVVWLVILALFVGGFLSARWTM
jgi:hypothetical protein